MQACIHDIILIFSGGVSSQVISGRTGWEVQKSSTANAKDGRGNIYLIYWTILVIFTCLPYHRREREWALVIVHRSLYCTTIYIIHTIRYIIMSCQLHLLVVSVMLQQLQIVSLLPLVVSSFLQLSVINNKSRFVYCQAFSRL